MPAELLRGTMLGRYVVLSRLGAGGMGVVYAAYDPELDRKVGLKLLRSEAGELQGSGDSKARNGLLREAQALAKLQHPNVVAVHDVGTHEDRVWLAMELVEGATLRAWLGQRPRSWSDVLDVLVQAGRGVAAAHAAELLHRDLKPDNIMVADDGRVRVMDFGLARDASFERPSSGLVAEAIPEAPTARGSAVVGTPGYIAPELLAKTSEVGPRADQFSFCVTLWEALFGSHPFCGETAVARAVAVLEGRVQRPRAGSGVPTWLRRIVDRGLSVDPAKRWASMDALLEALQRGRSRARRRRASVLVAGLALCAGGVWGWRGVELRQQVAACEAEGASITEMWNDERRETLRDTLVRTSVKGADVTARNVMPWLDAQAHSWQDTRTEACLDARVRSIWDAEMLERGLWCLDERWMELEALVNALSRGEPEHVQRAVTAAAGLGPVSSCRQTDLLVRRPLPPGASREQIRVVRVDLAGASALVRTGAYADGLMLAREVLVRAEALAWGPLVAEAKTVVGDLLDRVGDHEQAEEVLEAAYFEAVLAGAPEVAARAAERLVSVVGYRLARSKDGLRWLRHAEVAAASLPDVAGLREARRLDSEGDVRTKMGAHAEAKALYERALALREKALGSAHPTVALSLQHLASSHWGSGAYEEARELYERALALQQEALGPAHPEVAQTLNNLAAIHQALGEYDDARTLGERALSLWENALGPEHPDVALALNNLASLHAKLGAYDQAKPLMERALRIREKVLGSEHPDLAQSLGNLALVLVQMGDYETASTLHARALEIKEAALGPEHASVGMSLHGLAELRAEMGSHEEAYMLFDRARAIWEKALGADHPHLAYALDGLAKMALKRGDTAEAVRSARRALELRERVDSPVLDREKTRFVLARALWEEDRGRAVELARRARETLLETGVAESTVQLEAIDAWLADHADQTNPG